MCSLTWAHVQSGQGVTKANLLNLPKAKINVELLIWDHLLGSGPNSHRIYYTGSLPLWREQQFVLSEKDTHFRPGFSFYVHSAFARTTICGLSKFFISCHDILLLNIVPEQENHFKVREMKQSLSHCSHHISYYPGKKKKKKPAKQ